MKKKTLKKISKHKDIKKIVIDIDKQVDELSNISCVYGTSRIKDEITELEKKLDIKWIKQKKYIKKNIFSIENIFLITRRVVMIFFSLFVLLFWLSIIKNLLIQWLNLDFFYSFFHNPVKSFFTSYVLTEFTMSWSPIAWAFVSLSDLVNINKVNLISIIVWTRWWINTFLLFSWMLLLFKWKSLKRSLWVWVVQFFVTFSVSLFSLLFIFYITKLKFIDNIVHYFFNWLNIKLISSSVFSSITNFVVSNISNNFLALFVWFLFLIFWLFMFDRSFSFLSHWKWKKTLDKIINIKTSFIFGFIITLLTMSLSISLAIMIPLYERKVINRKMLIAYILWANISTLFDTLLLWILSESKLWLNIIISFIFSVLIVVIIYLVFFKLYSKIIIFFSDLVLLHKKRFMLFVMIVMILPIFLMFIL